MDVTGYNPRMRGVEKQPTFANWFPSLEPQSDSSPQNAIDAITEKTVEEPAPSRRGRGRPRVNKTRNETAIEVCLCIQNSPIYTIVGEYTHDYPYRGRYDTPASTNKHQKRRAQVREAQRTYQKRKDLAVASDKTRADDVLEAMSDLSQEIEALLQSAVTSGIMTQQSDLSDRMRQLWKSYDQAITKPCMKPELRLLQVKNDRRRDEHPEFNTPGKVTMGDNEPAASETPPSVEAQAEMPVDTSDMALGCFTDSTLIQSFAHVQARYAFGQTNGTSGKSIWQECENRRQRWRDNNDIQMRSINDPMNDNAA